MGLRFLYSTQIEQQRRENEFMSCVVFLSRLSANPSRFHPWLSFTHKIAALKVSLVVPENIKGSDMISSKHLS